MGVPPSSERAPRLVLRFALYSALALLLAGLGILWFVRHEAQTSAERAVLKQARLTVGDLARELGERDFRRPAVGAHRASLDRLFEDELAGGVVRVRLWNPDGIVTYATDHSLIGERDDDPSALGRALKGAPVLDTARLDDEGGAGPELKVLAARVAVTLEGAERPAGVLGLDMDYSPVAEDIREVVTPVAAFLALALLLLYGALFPILRQVTKALEQRNSRLAEQAAELERTLAERRDAVLNLHQAETRYRALVEQLPLVTYIDELDETCSSIYMSPQIEPLLGYAPGEWLADSELFPKLLHPDDRERVLEEHRRHFAQGRSFSTEYRLVSRDGRVIWVEDRVMVVKDAAGRPIHAQGFLLDSTERKLAEESLAQAEEQYRTLVEQLPLVTYVTDGKSTITYVSHQVEALLGLPSEALVGRSIWRDCLHPDDREHQLAAWKRWAEEGDGAFQLQYRLVRPDGKVIWVEDSAIAVRDAAGRTLYHQGFLFDVTERKAAQEAMSASEERFRTLVTNVPGVIFRCAVDEHWTAEFLSDAIEGLTGYPASDFIGNRVRTLVSIVHPEDRDANAEEIDRAVAEWRPYVIEYRVLRKDGETRWVLERGQAVAAGADDVSLDGVMFDVTETKLAEAERERLFAEAELARTTLAAQNERLLELDRLKDEFIALVSHELRTPLTSIRGYLELLLEGEAGELNDEQLQFLAIVERNSHRLLHLVGDLLFLAQVEAGKLALEVEAVDLAAVASESVEAVRPLAEEKGITLTLATGPVPLFAGDGGRIAQLLDNLVSNGLKFTPAGGRVDIRVRALRGNAVLEVRDTGMGIPADEQAHLFERFFRSSTATDRAIPGTGLGLAISKAIAEAHRGAITVASEESAGTTFRVSIPIEATAAVPEAEQVAL